VEHVPTRWIEIEVVLKRDLTIGRFDPSSKICSRYGYLMPDI